MELSSLKISPWTIVLSCFLWLGFTTVTSRQTECIFYQGASIVTFCEKGCCDNKCCEDSPSTGTVNSTAFIAGIAAGLFVLVAVIILVVVCCTKRRWKNLPCQKKRQVDTADLEGDPLEQPHASSAPTY